MKFTQALYKNEEEITLMPVDEIIQQKNFTDIIENLYCPEPKCTAKLVYNRKSNGLNYLSKHKGFEHDEECFHYTDEIKQPNTSGFYIEMNGDLTSDGIERRKGDISEYLEKFLNPPKINPEEKTPPKPRRGKDENDRPEDGTRSIIKKVYNPEKDLDDIPTDEDIKIIEPSFFLRLLHQISRKDANKNLRTFGIIKKIEFNNDKTRANIFVEFEGRSATFVLPPDFFNGTSRDLAQAQLVEFIGIVKNYIEHKKTKIYLMTMCQSHDINENDLILFVYEPRFISFELAEGQKTNFKNLETMVAAISRNVI